MQSTQQVIITSHRPFYLQMQKLDNFRFTWIASLQKKNIKVTFQSYTSSIKAPEINYFDQSEIMQDIRHRKLRHVQNSPHWKGKRRTIKRMEWLPTIFTYNWHKTDESVIHHAFPARNQKQSIIVSRLSVANAPRKIQKTKYIWQKKTHYSRVLFLPKQL